MLRYFSLSFLHRGSSTVTIIIDLKSPLNFRTFLATLETRSLFIASEKNIKCWSEISENSLLFII